MVVHYAGLARLSRPLLTMPLSPHVVTDYQFSSGSLRVVFTLVEGNHVPEA